MSEHEIIFTIYVMTEHSFLPFSLLAIIPLMLQQQQQQQL